MTIPIGEHVWSGGKCGGGSRLCNWYIFGDVIDSSNNRVTVHLNCGVGQGINIPVQGHSLQQDGLMGSNVTFSSSHSNWGWWCTDDTHNLCMNPSNGQIGVHGNNTDPIDTYKECGKPGANSRFCFHHC